MFPFLRAENSLYLSALSAWGAAARTHLALRLSDLPKVTEHKSKTGGKARHLHSDPAASSPPRCHTVHRWPTISWSQGGSPTLSVRTFLFLFFWLHHVACGILVPQPGIEPMPPALEEWSLNHWTAQEVPKAFHFQIQQTFGFFGEFILFAF